MKILFVSDSYYPHLNGVYYFVCRIGPLLQNKGHEVRVIAPSENKSFSKKIIDGIQVYGIPSVPTFVYPGVRIPIPILLKSKIRKILIEFQPDVIHLQDHFLLSNTVVKINRQLGIRLIGTNHFMAENITALFKSKTLNWILEKFMWSSFSKVFNQMRVVTTPSEFAAELIRPKLKVGVKTISSGVDLNIFQPFGDTRKIREKYAIPDKPVLLFVGRLDPEKKIEEIIQAVAIAIKKIDFTFIIVGKGVRENTLRELAQKLGVTSHIIFTGFVPEEELPFFYKLSHCFIIASIAELLSLATLQAMACALPVITVNAGALGELVNHGENGYLFSPGDITSITTYIQDIFMHEELRSQMSLKSYTYIQKHDLNQMLLSFEQLYGEHQETDQRNPLMKTIFRDSAVITG